MSHTDAQYGFEEIAPLAYLANLANLTSLTNLTYQSLLDMLGS